MSADTPTARTDGAGGYDSLRAAWIPLAALCLAFFVEMVDNTLLTIALPTIGRELGSGTTALQWVAGAYSLTFGGLLLTAGSAADRLGRRRVLLVGLAAFGLQVGQHVIGLDHAATGQHQGKDFLAQGGQAGAPRCTVFFCGSQELSGRKQRHSTGL